MTRQKAMEYDGKLSSKLQDYADDCGENPETAKNIVDHFIEFIPDDDVKGMVFLNDEPVSYKLGNARIDLRKAILAGLELAASVNRPESIFNYIQLLIVSALFIRNATRQELTGIEAYAVYLLHRKGAYPFRIEEEQFILDLQQWYTQQKGDVLDLEEIQKAVSHLCAMNVTDSEDGKICLKEKVWGKLE